MIDPNLKKRLQKEATAPYRGLRKFIYISVGASGFIGAFIFFFQFLAKPNGEGILGNLALQLSVVALMGVLWQWEPEKRH
jgi:hypothetical protein